MAKHTIILTGLPEKSVLDTIKGYTYVTIVISRAAYSATLAKEAQSRNIIIQIGDETNEVSNRR